MRLEHPIRVSIACFLVSVASAQCETAVLRVTDPQADESLGLSLSVDGDTLLAGAPYRTVAGRYNGGAVSVFIRSAGRWIEDVRLERAMPDFDDRFGFAVAVQGDRAVIGVPGFGPLNGGRGLVFERTGSTWSQVAALQAADTGGGRQLGVAVALDGDLAVLGSSVDSELAYQAGVAYVFERVGGGWVQAAKLQPSGPGAMHNAHFGRAVVIHGDTVAVGAPGRYERGATFVFRRGASTWDLEQVLEASPLQRNFGRALDLEGERLLIGAGDWFATSGPGKAYVYERTGAAWSEDAVLQEPSGGDCDDSFGAAVALAGDRALVGSATLGCGGAATEGAVHLFELVNGAWARRWSHASEDGMGGLLGAAVDLSGGQAFASAPGATQFPLLSSAGEVVVIDPDAGAWSYCVAAANSAGPGAVLGWHGHPSVNAADFGLDVSGAIPGGPGLFYYGSSATEVPFGDGSRCVAGSTWRLNPPLVVDPAGTAELALDFGVPPVGSGPGALQPGSTVYFQFWYRDPAAGGAGFNLSDGLAATFCQ